VEEVVVELVVEEVLEDDVAVTVMGIVVVGGTVLVVETIVEVDVSSTAVSPALRNGIDRA
jgi:hypothetical protein